MDEIGATDDTEQQALWATVIARALKSLEDGRVAVWNDETDRRLRERIFSDP